jgi:NADH:ubiquinone oxidoreductase subunit D
MQPKKMDIKMSMEALIKHFKFFSTGLVLPKK